MALAKDASVEEFDVSSLDLVVSGGAPLDAGLADAVAERLGRQVAQGYGMTEMSPVSHMIPDGTDDIGSGTVGLSLPNVECRLVDPVTGEDVAVGERGEL